MKRYRSTMLDTDNNLMGTVSFDEDDYLDEEIDFGEEPDDGDDMDEFDDMDELGEMDDSETEDSMDDAEDEFAEAAVAADVEE